MYAIAKSGLGSTQTPTAGSGSVNAGNSSTPTTPNTGNTPANNSNGTDGGVGTTPSDTGSTGTTGSTATPTAKRSAARPTFATTGGNDKLSANPIYNWLYKWFH